MNVLARFEKRNGFWVGVIEGCPINITYKREATCRKWTAHYIKNHLKPTDTVRVLNSESKS